MKARKPRSFFIEYLKDMNIGAVIPSTRFIVRRVLKAIPFEDVKDVLELGAGEGVMTRAALAQLGSDASFVAFEPNQPMRETLALRTLDERLRIIDDIAENADRHIAGKKFDLVLASNPFSKIENRRRFIADIARRLDADGRLIIFNQHIPLGLKSDLKTCFSNVETSWEVRNIPPWAFIFVCSGPIK